MLCLLILIQVINKFADVYIYVARKIATHLMTQIRWLIEKLQTKLKKGKQIC